MQCPDCGKWWHSGGNDEAEFECYAVCPSCDAAAREYAAQMTAPKIVNASISTMPEEPWDPLPVITATFSDGSVKQLFSYFPDEISFLPSEFIGLTEEEAKELKATKDRTYFTGGYRPR